MRGKDIHCCPSFCPTRITPAYAGKRNNSCSRGCLMKDHPRLCGEKLPYLRLKRYLPGSPPPMRGKGSTTRVRSASGRITPAYAGKSTGDSIADMQAKGSPPPMRGKAQNCRYCVKFLGDHPRLCGEKAKSLPLRTA